MTRARNAKGYTLIELIVVTAIAAIMMGLVLSRPTRSPAALTRDAADLMAATMSQTISAAITAGGYAIFEFDVMGQTWVPWVSLDPSEDPPEALRQSLSEASVQFGTLALHGPLGQAAQESPGGVPQVRLTCSAWGQCDLAGTGTFGVVYLMSTVDSGANAAVTISSTGNVWSWRFESANAEWK